MYSFNCSFSPIVNSSIALIHTQRRARAIAGRELRNLKAEADALRRELNEWRDRATLPRVEEPPRSGDFLTLLTLEEDEIGEDERRAYEMRDRDDGDDEDDGPEDLNDGHVRIAHHPHQQPPHPMHQVHHQMGFPIQQSHHHHRMSVHTGGGLSPFDNSVAAAAAAALYDPHSMNTPVSAMSMGTSDSDKVAAWNAHHLYSAMTQSAPSPQQQWAQQAAQASLFTPPSTGHGGNGGAPPNPFASASNQAFLTNYTRQNNNSNSNGQQLFQGSPASASASPPLGLNTASIAPKEEDASSVGSGHGSPHHSVSSSPGSLELPSTTNSTSGANSNAAGALANLAAGSTPADFALDGFSRAHRNSFSANAAAGAMWGPAVSGFNAAGNGLLSKAQPLAVGGPSYHGMGLLM